MPAEKKFYQPSKAERVFNTFRRRPLRPFYSAREVQCGAAVLIVLAAVAGWVAWRGAHPDPALFQADEALLSAKGGDVEVYERPITPWVEPGTAAPGAATLSFAPFPDDIAVSGWSAAGPPGLFDESNLYNKINGRETFYKGYGFEKLHTLTLVSDTDDELAIDIELFDLGSVENALGAFAAEISNPDAAVSLVDDSMTYRSINGGFLVRGRYYARMIGSDDRDAIRAGIVDLDEVLRRALPAVPLPWVYEVFTGGLEIAPSQVQFHREGAFSFAFADAFYSAVVPGGETELFVSRRADPEAAAAMAEQIAEGFAGFGGRLPADTAPGTMLVKNEYINTVTAVRTRGRHVLGVRLAPSVADAVKWLDRLEQELAATDEQTVDGYG